MRSNPRLDKSSNAAPSHSKEHVSTQTLAGDFNMQQGIVRSDVWIQLETNHYLKQGQCLFSLTTVLICTNGSIVANDI